MASHATIRRPVYFNCEPKTPQDQRFRAPSCAVVEQMLIDEKHHAETALDAGGYPFPSPVKKLMTVVSSAMTASSYRL